MKEVEMMMGHAPLDQLSALADLVELIRGERFRERLAQLRAAEQGARRAEAAARAAKAEADAAIRVWSLNRQIGRFGTSQYLVYVAGSTAIQVRIVWPVGHQTTSDTILSQPIHRRQLALVREVCDPRREPSCDTIGLQ
jgi:hypothetical protein